jgi:hypothetical protein
VEGSIGTAAFGTTVHSDSMPHYVMYAYENSTYLLTYLIRSSYTFTVSRLFFFHFDHFTDGRTLWTSDQLVARRLPKYRTAQTE